MYKRIVLKLSGEALAGDKEGVSFDDAVVSALVKQIRQVMEMGTQVWRTGRHRHRRRQFLERTHQRRD